MKPTKVLLMLLVLPSSSALASAATYYVSPEGSDDASGTSAAAAWLSLSTASLRLAAGDTVLLQRGGRWLDQMLASAAPQLTVGAYGPATAPLPLIQHGRTLNLGPGGGACAAFTAAEECA